MPICCQAGELVNLRKFQIETQQMVCGCPEVSHTKSPLLYLSP